MGYWKRFKDTYTVAKINPELKVDEKTYIWQAWPGFDGPGGQPLEKALKRMVKAGGEKRDWVERRVHLIATDRTFQPKTSKVIEVDSGDDEDHGAGGAGV